MHVQPAGNTFIDNSVKPLKRGEAGSAIFLGLIGGGDAGLDAAMKEGGITKVHHVDSRAIHFLFYAVVINTTYVYGE